MPKCSQRRVYLLNLPAFHPVASIFGVHPPKVNSRLCFRRAKFWRKIPSPSPEDPSTRMEAMGPNAGKQTLMSASIRWLRNMKHVVCFLPPSKTSNSCRSAPTGSISLNVLAWKNGGRLQSRQIHPKVFASWAHSFGSLSTRPSPFGWQRPTSPFPVNVGRTGAFTPTPRLCRDCPPGTPGDGRLHLRHRNGWNLLLAIFKCHFQTKLPQLFLRTARGAPRQAHC